MLRLETDGAWLFLYAVVAVERSRNDAPQCRCDAFADRCAHIHLIIYSKSIKISAFPFALGKYFVIFRGNS